MKSKFSTVSVAVVLGCSMIGFKVLLALYAHLNNVLLRPTVPLYTSILYCSGDRRRVDHYHDYRDRSYTPERDRRGYQHRSRSRISRHYDESEHSSRYHSREDSHNSRHRPRRRHRRRSYRHHRHTTFSSNSSKVGCCSIRVRS